MSQLGLPCSLFPLDRPAGGRRAFIKFRRRKLGFSFSLTLGGEGEFSCPFLSPPPTLPKNATEDHQLVLLGWAFKSLHLKYRTFPH